MTCFWISFFYFFSFWIYLKAVACLEISLSLFFCFWIFKKTSLCLAISISFLIAFSCYASFLISYCWIFFWFSAFFCCSAADSASSWSSALYFSASTASYVSLSHTAWSLVISSTSPLSLADFRASSASTYSLNSLVAAWLLPANRNYLSWAFSFWIYKKVSLCLAISICFFFSS